ncbi:MAG: LamG domain-containing protein [Planctomycetes bacterium]|nr:LamG domain-containing protein [Planctomycetota bacterium]
MSIRGFAQGAVMLAAVTVLASAAPAAVVLQLDIEERGVTDLVPGFERITLDDGGFANATKTFSSGITVDINAVGFTFADYDRHRTSPSDYLSQAPIYRDFIYGSASDSPALGLNTTITGLTANQEYGVTIWSFDSGSPGPRVSDWWVQDARGHVSVMEDYTFDRNVAPVADTDNRFTFLAIADAGGQVVIEGRGDTATSGSSPAVFLNGLQLNEIGTPPQVVAVDINDRGASGPANTQPGFEEFLMHGSEGTAARTTTRDLDSARVTISGVHGNLDDRRRTATSDSATYDQQELQRDFLFAQNVGGVDEELDVFVEGLAPGQKYVGTVWSYDTSSNPARTTDWYANGELVRAGYQFAGSQVPLDNDSSSFSFYATADADGNVLLKGKAVITTDHALFLDAFKLSEFAGPTNELAIDFNNRGAGGAANTQAGFEEFTLDGAGLASASRAFGSAVVTVSGMNAPLDGRRRTAPSDGSDFDQQELLRDFVFANNGSVTDEGVDVRIQGLVPDQQYVASIWSVDDGSGPTRTSFWSANGELVRQYSFDGGAISGTVAPPANGYSFRFYATADADGEILINGQAGAGTQPSLFLNALQLAEPVAGDTGQAAYSQTVLNQQPLAYWRANDAGPGLTAADATANNNPALYNNIHGSSINAPDPSNGFVGFEGVNTSAMMGNNSGITNNLPDNGLFNDDGGTYQMGTDSGTVSFWVNVGDGIDGASARVMFQGSDAARGGFDVNSITVGFGTNTYGATQAGRLIAKGGDNTAWGSEDIRGTGWRLVTATWDGTDVNLYLDGRRQIEATAHINNGNADMTGQFRFGKASDRTFEGLMDEIAVFKDPLTPAQVQAQYNTAVDGFARTRGLAVDMGATGHQIQDGFETFELPTSPPAGDHTRAYASDFAKNGTDVTVTLLGNLNGARDRSGVTHTMGDLADSFVFGTNEVSMTLGNLAPGYYELVTYHHDQAAQQKTIDILVTTDAIGADVPLDLGIAATTGSNPNDIASGSVTFMTYGQSDVLISFQDNGEYTRSGSVVALSGFELHLVDRGVPEPSTFVLAVLGLLGLGLIARRRKSA